MDEYEKLERELERLYDQPLSVAEVDGAAVFMPRVASSLNSPRPIKEVSHDAHVPYDAIPHDTDSKER